MTEIPVREALESKHSDSRKFPSTNVLVKCEFLF